MGAKPETTFYTSIHRHLPPPSKLHREKMANPYRGGTADHWYSGPKADLWIEWKFIVVPKRGRTIIDLCGGKQPIISALQQDWLASRYREGRHVWVVVGSTLGGVIFRHCSWQSAFCANEYAVWCEPRADIAWRIAEHTGFFA